MSSAGRDMLNIGCGRTLHPDWINIDVSPASADVMRWDVNAGLPFADGSFDAVYCSHVLEHLVPEQAQALAGHMLRVLRPGGVARVVVPDLEAIAREYLRALEDVESGIRQREPDYDWMVLELLDQAVRSVPGGRMGTFLSRQALPNRSFILSRVGAEAQQFWDKLARGGRMSQLADGGPGTLWRLARNHLRPVDTLAGWLARLVSGRNAQVALREGMFRRSGEVHQWMYDRFSLARMLRDSGFEQVNRATAHSSAIPGFANFYLDVGRDGAVRKPDSLYMEGVRTA